MNLLYGKDPRWEEEAAKRKDVAESKLAPPTLLFPNAMIFDDGQRRVELIHFGIAHTHGDAFMVPKEGILFRGMPCQWPLQLHERWSYRAMDSNAGIGPGPGT